MRKSSRSISLALIGSALWLGGCQPAAVENENESEWGETSEDVVRAEPGSTLDGVATGNDQYNEHHSGGMGRTASRIGGAMIGSQIGRAIGGGGASARPGPGGGYGGSPGGMTSSPSSRGGFGSSGGFGASS